MPAVRSRAWPAGRAGRDCRGTQRGSHLGLPVLLTQVWKGLSEDGRSWGGFARCFLFSRRKAPSPLFSPVSASRGWSSPAPGPCSEPKERIHIPGTLQASFALLEHKSSSACTKRTARTGAPAIPCAEPIERMSGPKMKRSSLIYLARHLAASIELSSALRAGLWRHNLTSAAAGDDRLQKGQHEILFSQRFHHRSSSLQKVHFSRLQSWA